jgi:hypothetical protein
MSKNIYPTTLFFNFVFLHETFHGFMALLLLEKITTVLSKSTHEWPRVTTSDHEWPRMTTSDHEWPRVISVFKSHKIIIKIYFSGSKGFLHYTTLLYPENSCFFTLHDTKAKFIGHIDNALLNIAIYYFCAESPLPWWQRVWIIKLKICLFPAVLKI